MLVLLWTRTGVERGGVSDIATKYRWHWEATRRSPFDMPSPSPRMVSTAGDGTGPSSTASAVKGGTQCRVAP
eukprot:11275771-Karenia_brevis.AAC.1